MARVAAVTFQYVQGPQYFRVTDEELGQRAKVVATTRFGRAVGTVVQGPYAAGVNLPEDLAEPATDEQLTRREENRELARASLSRCSEMVKHHELPMKLVACFWSLDRRHLTFFFTAPGRVDFRRLLRDVVREFRAQIRLEQVGERDVARLLGGIGRCGRELCCTTWMPRFQPVSLNHAKAQGLAPVPTHLAGACGKLRCCLRHEYYEDEHDPRHTRRREPDASAGCGGCAGD